MKKTKLCMLPLMCLLMGCGGGQQSTQPTEYTGGAIPLMNQLPSQPKVIDVENAIVVDYDELIADIQYLPLGDEKGLIGSMLSQIIYYKGIYYLFEEREDAVFLFDEQGKNIKYIETKGQGPKDYIEIGNIDINPQTDELIIKDRLQDRILFYDLKGNFKYTQKSGTQNVLAYSLTDSTMILGLDTHSNYGNEEVRHHMMLSMKGDSIVGKALKYLPSQIGFTGTDALNRGYDHSLLYLPLASDSIYRITSASTYTLEYYAKFENSVWKKNYQSEEFVNMMDAPGDKLFPWIYENKDFFVGYTNTHRSAGNTRMTCVLYEKETGKTYAAQLKGFEELKELTRISSCVVKGVKDNYFICTMSSGYIEEAIKTPYKEGKLKITDPRLKEIVENIDSDCNHLLVLVKFKRPDVKD